MNFRKANESDVARIVALIAREPRGPLSNPIEAIAAQIKRDIESGQSEWVLSGNAVIARIAVIPAPPIYRLNGLAGVVLGVWREADADTNVDILERHMRDQGVAALVMACDADDRSMPEQLAAHGYIATTNFMLKQALTSNAGAQSVRLAKEDDIPALVAFNRENRERLHEANPAFWNSHPDAEARFALWMKFSLTMRDRSVFVAEREGKPAGFAIAQPSSPIQTPIEFNDTLVGVVDDFHCATFGGSLKRSIDAKPAQDLLQTVEHDFADRGKTAAIAICPVAWKAKAASLESAGYQTLFTWHTKGV